jgi:hypothetical protein
MMRASDELDAAIARVAGPNIAVSFSQPVEAFAALEAENIIAAARPVLTSWCKRRTSGAETSPWKSSASRRRREGAWL